MSKYYISKDQPSPYLIHSGVKGMKHGVRKYQYTDGSLTPEGRVHYGVGPPRGERKGEVSKEKKSGGNETYDQMVTFTPQEQKLLNKIKNFKSYDGRATTKAEKKAEDQYWELMDKQLDTSNFTDKELKAQIEKEIIEAAVNYEGYTKSKMSSIGMSLWRTIIFSEVALQYGKPVSQNFRKAYEDYYKNHDKDAFSKSMLKEVGFEVNPTNISLMRRLCFNTVR